MTEPTFDTQWQPEPRDPRWSTAAAIAALFAIVAGGVGVVAFTLLDREEEAPLATASAPIPPSDTAAAIPAPPDPAVAALEAQEEVEKLQQELTQAQEQILAFQEDEAQDQVQAEAGRARRAELNAEIDRLKGALAQAEAERDSLRAELASTLARLDEQIALTARVEEEREIWHAASDQNLWAAFVQSAKVELCDKGTRKAHGRCHETIGMVLTAEARADFDHCVRSKGAVPGLIQVADGAEAPAFSKPFPEGTRLGRKDWYIQYCDPTLPEATMAQDGGMIDPTILVVASR